MLESGIDRIISQVVDPKINHTFRPQVEKAVHEFLATLSHKEDTSGSTAPEDEKPDSSTITQGALLSFLVSPVAFLLTLITKLGVFSSLKYFSFWPLSWNCSYFNYHPDSWTGITVFCFFFLNNSYFNNVVDGCVCVSVEAIITVIREHILFLGTRLFSRLHNAWVCVTEVENLECVESQHQCLKDWKCMCVCHVTLTVAGGFESAEGFTFCTNLF